MHGLAAHIVPEMPMGNERQHKNLVAQLLRKMRGAPFAE